MYQTIDYKAKNLQERHPNPRSHAPSITLSPVKQEFQQMVFSYQESDNPFESKKNTQH